MNHLNEHVAQVKQPLEKGQKLEQVHIYGVPINKGVDSGSDRVKHVKATTEEVIQYHNLFSN